MSEDSIASYRYRDLKWDQDEIRIVVLEPSMDPSADLRFSFEYGNLDDLAGSYEAISYVWGAPVLEHTIYHIDGNSTLCITASLNKALRRFRDRLDARRLWADAVCINQRDPKDKTKQIPKMVEIFRSAKRVLAWLGEGDEAVEHVLISINRLSVLRPNKNKARTQESDAHRGLVGAAQSHSKNYNPAYDKLVGLLDLPYFRRMWIIQEITFNPEVILFYGSAETNWLRLLMSLASSNVNLNKTKRRTTLDIWIPPPIEAIASIWRNNCTAQRKLPPDENTSLLRLVETFGEYGCADDHDKIYALVSMAEDHSEMRIDYEYEVLDLYRSFAVFYMLQDEAVDVLKAASAYRGDGMQLSWPSWVPDWRVRSTSGVRLDFRHPRLPWTYQTRYENAPYFPNRIEVVVRHTLFKERGLDTQIRTRFPCRVSKKSVNELENTFWGSVSSIVDLCKTIRFGTPWQIVLQLSDVLSVFYGFHVTVEFESRLHDCLGLVWNGTSSEAHLPDDDITKAVMHGISLCMQDHCFFGIECSIDVVCIGYATSKVNVGDRLVVGDSYQESDCHLRFNAFIIRDVPGDEYKTKDSGIDGARHYTFVGCATLFFFTEHWNVTQKEDWIYLH